MKHICHEVGLLTKTLMFLCDSVAKRGIAPKVGSPSHRGEVIVVAVSHGREEVSDEACSYRVKHCWHRYEGVDERQNMEFGEPDGNEFGCWCVLSCAAANGENHGDVDSSPW